jgi:transcriptional regulator with XRE-family HTH domain
VSKTVLAQQLASFMRKKRGESTLKQFSRKTGISDSSLQRIEGGRQNVSLATLQHIIDRFKCSIADIFCD